MSLVRTLGCWCVQLLWTWSCASAQRLRITNGCKEEPLWVAHMAGVEDGPDRQNLKLKPGQHHDFNTRDGLSSTRYWPKMRCNKHGQECLIGESGGPGQECNETMGCAPPIDSKFEGTFGTDDGIDWIDVSLVDGWTLPFEFKMILKKGKKCNAGDGDRKVYTSVDCSNLTLDQCPGHERLGKHKTHLRVEHPTDKQVVGCYSPCAKLTSNNWGNTLADGVAPEDEKAVEYCCPTPPESPESCRKGPVEKTNFVKAVHKHCPGVYGYSYDDGMGLITCPKDTKYEMIYHCPGGEGSSSGSKTSKEGAKRHAHSAKRHSNGTDGSDSNATNASNSTRSTNSTGSTDSTDSGSTNSSNLTSSSNSSGSAKSTSSSRTEEAPHSSLPPFVGERARDNPYHEYCGGPSLWKGVSLGQGNCQDRCLKDEKCNYFSFWHSGKINWCRLSATCDLRAAERWERISMFRRRSVHASSSEPDNSEGSEDGSGIQHGEVIHILRKDGVTSARRVLRDPGLQLGAAVAVAGLGALVAIAATACRAGAALRTSTVRRAVLARLCADASVAGEAASDCPLVVTTSLDTAAPLP